MSHKRAFKCDLYSTFFLVDWISDRLTSLRCSCETINKYYIMCVERMHIQMLASLSVCSNCFLDVHQAKGKNMT